jgi:hypothetical protein
VFVDSEFDHIRVERALFGPPAPSHGDHVTICHERSIVDCKIGIVVLEQANLNSAWRDRIGIDRAYRRRCARNRRADELPERCRRGSSRG